MDELLKLLYAKAEKVDEIIEFAKKDIAGAPVGSLRITMNHNTEQYYVKKDAKDTYGSYISKKKEVIHKIAEKEYAEKILIQLEKEKESLQHLIDQYDPKGIESIYESLSSKRKKLVQPYILPESQFVKQWMNSGLF